MAKLNFQQLYYSRRLCYDPSEIILICWFVKQNNTNKIIIIINAEASCAA